MKKNNIFKYYIYTFLRSAEFILPILTLFYLMNKLSFTEIFFLQSWFTLTIMIFEIPSGAAADLIGRKKLIIISGFIHFVACFIYSLSSTFGMFMLCETLWGISAAFSSGTTDAFVYDSLKDLNLQNQGKRVFANVQTIRMISLALSSILGAFLAGLFGYRFVFFITGFSFLSAFLFSFWFHEPKCVEKAPKVSLKTYIDQFKEGFRIISRNSRLLFLVVDSMIMSTCIALTYLYFAPLLQDRGLDMVLIGVVTAIFNLFTAGAVYLIPTIERKAGSNRTIIFTEIIPSVFMIILGLNINLVITIIGFIVIHGINRMREPLFADYFNSYLETKHRATVLSVISFISSIAYSVMGPIIGLTSDKIGLEPTILSMGIVVLVLSGILHFVASRVKAIKMQELPK